MESSNVLPSTIPSNVVPSQEPDCVPQLTKKVVRMKLAPMLRRCTGSRGQKISLITNHFKISITHMSCQFYYYNVFLSHEDGQAVNKKGIGRRIMSKLFETYALELSVKDFAYDGEKGLFTLGPLSHTKLEFIVVLENKSSDRNDNIGGNENPDEGDRKRVRRAFQATTFKVEISYVGKIPLQAIKNALHVQGLDNFQEILRVLNIILKDHAAKQGCLLVGQSFFQNEAKNFMPLGEGIYGCRGFHSCFRATQDKLSLNFDVSSTTIIQPGPVIDFLMANQNLNNCFHIDWKKAERTLKNLRIMVAPSNEEYRITGLSKGTCKKQTFQLNLMRERQESSAAHSKIVSVYDYFVNHRDIVLHYSADYPCINVGKPNKPIYFPIELCSLVSLQRYTKALTIHQRSSLVEKASHRPKDRIRILTDALKSNNYDVHPMLNSLGLSINTHCTQVEGRILSAPRLRVGDKEDIIPRNGRWSLNNKKFFEAAKIKRWAVANFSSPFDIGNLCKDLRKAGEIKGMVIDSPKVVFEENPRFRQAPPSVRVEKMFEQIQSKFPEDEPPFFLLCLLSDRKISRLYGPWKRKTLTDFGVFNQCLAPTRVNEQYLTNILCKINVKLGGLNSVLAAEHLKHIPLVSKAPTIIFGMDVSHGSSGQFDVPSVAAVVSSRYWPLISRYKAATRTQPPKVEMINSLFKPVSEKKDLGMIRELLVDFYASSGKRKPTQIIIFRDGVGESQFNQVLNLELGQIIEACKFLDDSWSPKFTVIVALKRHHTRFFPSKSLDNVPPGTIVDSKVCHPQYYDFYMCPHSSPIGTTRPIHYYVLLDENGFPTDELQELIHSLSHVYQKGTTAISEVAPIRYAHLAAAQMLAILNSDNISEINSSHGSLPNLHEDVCSSMFFC